MTETGAVTKRLICLNPKCHIIPSMIIHDNVSEIALLRAEIPKFGPKMDYIGNLEILPWIKPFDDKKRSKSDLQISPGIQILKIKEIRQSNPFLK